MIRPSGFGINAETAASNKFQHADSLDAAVISQQARDEFDQLRETLEKEDILVYVFWKTPNWATELRERHRFLLDCLRLAKRLGVEYAFPTQTLHMIEAQGGPPKVEDGEFSPLATEDEAKQRGLKEARDIVRETTGLDRVPPPVILGENMGDEDGE